MALKISAWSIHRPLPPILLFVALSVLGLAAFRGLPVASMPELRVPAVAIKIAQSGAAPAELETEVTRRVEAAVTVLTGVSKVTSTITEGQSQTTVTFDEGTPVERALDDVRDALGQIATDLPGTAEEPVIQRVEETGGAVATYALLAPTLAPQDQAWLVDDRVTRALSRIPGVARITREGGSGREIRVALDPARLQALGATTAEVNDLLSAALVDRTSGRSETGAQDQALRLQGGVARLADLAALELRLPGGQAVALGDLAEITDGAAEARGAAFLDGQPVVAFSVTAAAGASAPEVARAVAAVIAGIEAETPEARFRLIDSPVAEIEATYRATMDTLIEGAILAVVVVFLFLGDIRATLIAALAIPLSILPTFWVMGLLGFSLNNVSLLAVTLVTGVLVDDAIVEVENIIRHMRGGKSPFNAALEAADEIGLAVVATSACIVAVFLPVSFMSGLIGQIFKQFGVTIAVSVVFSLLVARLITPLLAAYFMAPTANRHARGPGPVLRRYLRLLDWALRHRGATVLAGGAVLAVSVWAGMQLPSGFLPDEDGARSQLSVELPQGLTLAQAGAVLLRVSDTLGSDPDVTSVYASLGEGADLSRASLSVALTPAAAREIDQRGVERRLQTALAALPDIRASFTTGMSGRDFAMALTGAGGPALTQAAERIEAAIGAQVPTLQNVQTMAAGTRPELRVIPRPADAAALGVSAEDLATELRIATQGDIAQNLAQFSEGARQIGIRVTLPETARSDRAVLGALLVRAATGAAVPLAAVAEIAPGAGPASIERENGLRRIRIEADLAPGADLGTALAAVLALDAVTALPAGIRFAEAGDAEEMGKLFSAFLATMGFGLMLVLIVLILLYSDPFQPFTILLSLPLSLGGAVAALLLTGHGISMSVVIGVLMLIAVVTKNAILLVDFAVEAMRRGVPRLEALRDAGRKRAQPIVMTTIAMTAGMLPAALATGTGDGFRVPMAIAVIGGLVVSTLLSLLFVPAVFTYLDDLRQILGRRLGPLITGRAEAAPASAGQAGPEAAE